MDLIIKPTGCCNFNCKFCSAYGLDIAHPKNNKVPEQIKDYIKKTNPTRLIITGGEPLTLDPSYYYELHELSGLQISPTTNLKDFYYHPEKWAPIMNEPWFNISTSFNYGDTRMWDSNTVYTEEMFLKVIDKYCKYVNKNVPPFIAVIDESNEDTIIDTVLLAKRIGTNVKINCAEKVGKQGKCYPRYKMFRHYIDIIDAGLGDYEANCIQRSVNKCPGNIYRSCIETIRCIFVDSNGKLHVGTCDERISDGFELPEDKIYPTDKMFNELPMDDLITPECMYCELSRLCNGCDMFRKAAKEDPIYCEEMKKLETEIINHGWLL